MEVALTRAGTLGEGSSRQAERDRLRIPTTAANEIRPVTTDSLCAAAWPIMAKVMRAADTGSHTVYMVNFGKLYWAMDPKLGGGEFTQVFILDSALTKVVARTAI